MMGNIIAKNRTIPQIANAGQGLVPLPIRCYFKKAYKNLKNLNVKFSNYQLFLPAKCLHGSSVTTEQNQSMKNVYCMTKQN
mgnify:CR=1 FL=1